MEDYPREKVNGNHLTENGHNIRRQSPCSHSVKVSFPRLDLKVFYVRVSQCALNDFTPEYLTLNHMPLDQDTLLEVNGVRTSTCSDGVSTLLRRDRLDKKSKEITYVSTDNLRMTGSVKFVVFYKTLVVLSGVLELCHSNGFTGKSNGHGQMWSMHCNSDILQKTDFTGKQCNDLESASSAIEVYVAGSFFGNPIILTKSLQLCSWKKHTRRGMLESIPEYEARERQKDVSYGLALQVMDYSDYMPEKEGYNHDLCSGMDHCMVEGEEGELLWFNAGVRVGVGIGLSICLGIGIGVGLVVRNYQGTTRNIWRRLL